MSNRLSIAAFSLAALALLAFTGAARAQTGEAFSFGCTGNYYAGGKFGPAETAECDSASEEGSETFVGPAIVTGACPATVEYFNPNAPANGAPISPSFAVTGGVGKGPITYTLAASFIAEVVADDSDCAGVTAGNPGYVPELTLLTVSPTSTACTVTGYTSGYVAVACPVVIGATNSAWTGIGSGTFTFAGNERLGFPAIMSETLSVSADSANLTDL